MTLLEKIMAKDNGYDFSTLCADYDMYGDDGYNFIEELVKLYPGINQ